MKTTATTSGLSPSESLPKKEATPAKEAASSGEQRQNDMGEPHGQVMESALMALCKSWMRAGITDRRLFLQDVKEGSRNLWREVSGDLR